MLDTNVLISATLFPSNRMNTIFQYISLNHDLVLSSFVIEELKDVVRAKFPDRVSAIDKMITELSFEYVYTPEDIPLDEFNIRDEKDYPVLYTAIHEDVDILITGDKDFADVQTNRIEILTPADFIEEYIR